MFAISTIEIMRAVHALIWTHGVWSYPMHCEKKAQNISDQQFAETFLTQGSTEVLYLFSVEFCTELYGDHRK